MLWRRRFFFQAEDGIRYRNVTGVQTCALPISASSAAKRSLMALALPSRAWRHPSAQRPRASAWPAATTPQRATHDFALASFRSEERRVGQEGRSLRVADHGEGSNRGSSATGVG